MAYPAHMAAALSGATLSQLAHWRRATPSGAVLVPEISATRPIRYSFRDVVALRTCVFLRRARSLQKIRRAIGNLRGLGELGHLSEYSLVAEGSSIVLVEQDEAIDLVEKPGQQLMAEMNDVLQPFVNRRYVEIPALFKPRPRIVIDPGVRLGHPVIAGTRVPFENVADLVADGVPVDQIRDYYPDVDAGAASEALDFAEYVEGWRTGEGRPVPAA